MVISLVVLIISQYIRISNARIVHLNYIQLLFVNYTSIKLREKKNILKKASALQKNAFEAGAEGIDEPVPFLSRKENVRLKGYPLSQWASLHLTDSSVLWLPQLLGFLGEQAFLEWQAHGYAG